MRPHLLDTLWRIQLLQRVLARRAGINFLNILVTVNYRPVILMSRKVFRMRDNAGAAVYIFLRVKFKTLSRYEENGVNLSDLLRIYAVKVCIYFPVYAHSVRVV